MASGGTEVARAYVTIIPKSDGTANRVATEVVAPFGKSGADAGTKASEGFSGTFGAGMAKAGKMLGAIGLGVAVADFGRQSVEAGMQFDASMSQVAATMGTTVDQIGNLRDFAQQMGSTTKFSASESADALNYMALAGYDAETSMKMLPNVLNLAAAGGMDLARASDMVTDTQSALGLSLDETSALVDKMAKASSKTNTSVGQLGDALLTVGGTAKTMKGGTTEAATALGLLADNGIKGSEGGTALRNMLLSLQAPTDKAAGFLDELGVQVFDADGKMRGMKDIMLDMNDALGKLSSDEERTYFLSNIFNKVDLKSANALLSTNAERWDEVTEAIDGSKGAAEEMAKTQLDNLDGDVTTFKSALEGLQIQISDAVTPALRGLVQVGTAGLGALTEMMKWVNERFSEFGEGLKSTIDFDGFKEAFDGLGAAVSEALGGTSQVNAKSFGEVVGSVVNSLIPVIKTLTPVIAGIASVASTVFTFISEKANAFIAFMQEVVIPVATEIGGQLAPIIQEIASTVGGALSEIARIASEVITSIFGESQENLPQIRDFVLGIVDGIRQFFETAWPVISQVVSTAMEIIGQIVQVVWPVVQFVIESASRAIEFVVNEVFPKIAQFVEENMGKVDAAIRGIQTVVSVVSGIFEGVKRAIEDPIGTAKGFIEDAMGTIQGIFDGLDFSLPSIALPHFEVWGGEFPWGIGGQGSAPEFDVKWYGSGGFADTPTLRGYGERGLEFYWPSYEPYFDRYAQGIAEHMPASAGGVTITGNTFNVRRDSDIRAVAQELNTLINRQQAGAFA